MPKFVIRRALISVSDKTGLAAFVQELKKMKVEIISTGGTLKAIREAGVTAMPIDEWTGFPEMMEGRVKTLHPKVHGGLLYRRDKKEHADQAKQYGIGAIDLVVVNLYPFETVTADPKTDLETAIENIDIGGPSMLRSAAKNAAAVTVVSDPADYGRVLADMKKNRGAVSETLRFELAVKVFEKTSSYDRAIAAFLSGRVKKSQTGEIPQVLPASYSAAYSKAQDLRYGENPHQRAALYVPAGSPVPRHFIQLHGKELSYNNLLDIEATLDVIGEFRAPAACVIKHSNPCGVAESKTLLGALEDAIASDPLSAFGGIVAVNRPCDLKAAQKAFERLNFFEVLIAPAFSKEALEYLKARKNLRLIETGAVKPAGGLDLRYLKSGGLLIQDADPAVVSSPAAFKKQIRFVTKKKLKGADLDALIFAFQCVKTVKSNAIVLTQGKKTVGIGAGQMSRVDSVEIACRKAGDRTRGAMLASDAFFPMPDSIEIAHKHGIRAILQPGGSIKDPEVIQACERFGIAMAFSGKRHFKH
ncbi:MAG: bifunctional phosphoribosylaminoimidazolecarboxamide formyltransferase/IMP cyclohydrolase [Candidatus Omnitrophica bacterium]|nr:bifunctional phosphoribosylaminoimidazolecarboxamide formyltransferase/IMP cyclohydrolase [Candidatus Omnitrophota bacterium]